MSSLFDEIQREIEGESTSTATALLSTSSSDHNREEGHSQSSKETTAEMISTISKSSLWIDSNCSLFSQSKVKNMDSALSIQSSPLLAPPSFCEDDSLKPDECNTTETLTKFQTKFLQDTSVEKPMGGYSIAPFELSSSEEEPASEEFNLHHRQPSKKKKKKKENEPTVVNLETIHLWIDSMNTKKLSSLPWREEEDLTTVRRILSRGKDAGCLGFAFIANLVTVFVVGIIDPNCEFVKVKGRKGTLVCSDGATAPFVGIFLIIVILILLQDYRNRSILKNAVKRHFSDGPVILSPVVNIDANV